ncbi:MAG: YncE family protein [Bacteroidetes bacterium]|nr:YncE family protein [Bacteroidota bacterium]
MKKINDYIYYITILCSLLTLFILPASCSKEPIREEIIDTDTTTRVVTYENGIFVVNEGNYNWGNASVTFLDNSKNVVIQDIFTKSNGRTLGDVAESMTIAGKLGYLVINNSNLIEVVSIKDFKSVNTISGLHSPRFLQAVDSGKAYVTNLQNFISVIDLHTNSVVRTIKTTSWTENLIRYDKFMLVTSIGMFSEPTSKRKAQIFVIDTETDAIVDSIQSGKEPIGLIMDKKQKVWVLCSGGYDNFETPSLIRINPELRIVEKVFAFPDSKEVPSRLCINPTGDTIYYLKGGVYQMPVISAALPTTPLIKSEGRLFYGLNIHPATGRIYVSDAKDYVQNGTAYQYSVTGKLITQYTTGRIPGSFCFTQNITK